MLLQTNKTDYIRTIRLASEAFSVKETRVAGYSWQARRRAGQVTRGIGLVNNRLSNELGTQRVDAWCFWILAEVYPETVGDIFKYL